jgi:hypothetical protein
MIEPDPVGYVSVEADSQVVVRSLEDQMNLLRKAAKRVVNGKNREFFKFSLRTGMESYFLAFGVSLMASYAKFQKLINGNYILYRIE